MSDLTPFLLADIADSFNDAHEAANGPEKPVFVAQLCRTVFERESTALELPEWNALLAPV